MKKVVFKNIALKWSSLQHEVKFLAIHKTINVLKIYMVHKAKNTTQKTITKQIVIRNNRKQNNMWVNGYVCH